MWNQVGFTILSWIIFCIYIKETYSQLQIDDEEDTAKVNYTIPSDIPVRIVATNQSLSKGNFHIKRNNTWVPLCNYVGTTAIQIDFEEKLKKKANSSYGDATADGFGVTTEFVKIECNGTCGYHDTDTCGEIWGIRCGDKAPEDPLPALTMCSYPGNTTYNCTSDQQWMTYEHIFYKDRKGLPRTFIAWTSSYLSLRTGESSCNMTEFCLFHNSTVGTDLDCFQSCFNNSDHDQCIAAIGIQGDTCSCYTRGTESTGCRSSRVRCDDQLYDVKAFTAVRDTRPNTTQYCIAYDTDDAGNRTFKVKPCSAYLPLVCGRSKCDDSGACKNGGKCVLLPNYDYKCNCPPDYAGEGCGDKVNVTTPAIPPSSTKPSLAIIDDGPSQTETVLFVVYGIGAFVLVAVTVAVFVLVFKYRSQQQKIDDVVRPHSAFNKTYGNSTPLSDYNRVDDDALSIYDLLDEDRMTKSYKNKDKEILLLEEYSQPTDVRVLPHKPSEYTTTYDDPVRRESGDELELMQDTSKKITQQNQQHVESDRSDVEQSHCIPKDLSEKSENGVGEFDNSMNQFKGCFCSMSVNADSDIETTNHATTDDIMDDELDKQSKLYERRGMSKFIRDSNGNTGHIVSYFKLDPLRLPNVKQPGDGVCIFTGDTRGTSGYETAAACKTECTCKVNREDVTRDDDDSDYEDTTIPTSADNKRRSHSLHNTKEVCLHSTAEELLRTMGIRLVMDCPYETYAALPRSRADMLNPYYSFGPRKITPAAEPTGANCSKVHSKGGTTGAPCEKEDGGSIIGEENSEYDKLNNTKKDKQQIDPSKINVYDHIPGFLGNHFSRKRLNTF